MLTKLLSNTLRSLADSLDAGNSNINEEEAFNIMTLLSNLNTNRPISKELACKYLHLSRSSFDTYIKNGIIPEGSKVLGFKELGWNKVLLDMALEKLKELSK